jgi:hypothetical protein
VPSAVQPIQFPTGVPITQKDGSVSHVWQRFFQDIYRKAGGTGNLAPLTSENIYGILASINQANNAQLNSTNRCTVDSVDNGTNATIRVYGRGGVGTGWDRIVGSTVFPTPPDLYPALSDAGLAYATFYYVMFNPTDETFLVTTNFSDILPDQYIWCGFPKTVGSGGGGGISGGGGDGGGSGGSCFTGPVKTITVRGFLRFDEANNEEWVLTRNGFRPARKLKFHYRGELITLGIGGVTPDHPHWRDGWISANQYYPDNKRVQFDGTVYTWEVGTNEEAERNFFLDTGDLAHNMSILS